jgi:hypothetical protein
MFNASGMSFGEHPPLPPILPSLHVDREQRFHALGVPVTVTMMGDTP